ncbi:MFS transporter [Leucobacter sp. BZR 635]
MGASGVLRSTTERRVGVAVIVGSALEWFDFYLYAATAVLVFNKVFFPDSNKDLALLAAFATFAVGYFARPIGGVLFGILADKIGRKRVLSITFLLMGISTGLIGLVPSYGSIGVAAPILLVLLRIAQGLGAGAEFGSAIAVAYEHAAKGQRGRLGAWPALGVNIGLFASSLVVFLLQTLLSEESLLSWGWRLPFVASFVLVFLGAWVRARMPETPEFEKDKANRAAAGGRKRDRSSLVELLRFSWRGVLVVGVVTLGYNSVSYVFKTFSLAYLVEFRGLDGSVGTLAVTLAAACAIGVAPLAGRLADRFSPRVILGIGGLATGAMAFPFFALLDTNETVLIWVALISTTGIAVPLMLAASGAYFAQQFPTRVRASGLGLGREVCGAFAGGLAPMIALAIVLGSPTNSPFGVSIMFLVGAALILVGVMFDQRKRAKRREGQLSEPLAAEIAPAVHPAD